ncbi:AbrB/MazE/SpoVT family DNA-binding domain-containing protein [Nocardiopsis potens]|uniref:AbrB/MazE/SpoVT family DNA-binding domain-containing protein n=1 Tax=Nocardiopsis potens TaxID=1246458 RepID=UPI0006846B0E|nr:AbrB/MazE/SpoVT family DNA-binding domain-containing protein [Nocardiopsis potens]
MESGDEVATEESKASYGPGGRGFYGAVTVSERGQIVIPAQARRDLGIAPGTKLLVLGDPEQGLALMTLDRLMSNLQGASGLLAELQKHAQGGAGEAGGPGESGGPEDGGGGESAGAPE